MLSCLNNIIGLSETNCACFDDGEPVDYNSSLSGFYLDNDFGLTLDFTNSASDCARGGVWDILESSRKQAINKFLKDYAFALNTMKKYRFQDVEGEIGSRKFNGTYTNSKNFVGYRIRPYCIIGAKYRLDAVLLSGRNIVAPIDTEVRVYSELDLTTPIATTTVSLTTSNQFVRAQFDTPVILDLNPDEEDIDYYIVFDASALTLQNNEIKRGCTCNARSYYRTNKFLAYADFNGIEADSFDTLNANNVRLTNKAYGLLLEGSLQCDYISQLCTLTNSFSFDTAVVPSGSGKYYHLGATLAAIIGHKAAYIAADKILTSTNINSIVLTRREELETIKYKNKAQYEKSLQFFVKNLPNDFTDCFTCKNPNFAAVMSLV